MVVLDFIFAGWGRGQSSGLTELAEVQRDYADKNVTFICIYSKASADKFLESLDDEARDLTFVLDPDRATTGEYFEGRFAAGLVLVGKDGTVQGRYSGFLTKDAVPALRKDLDKLLAGETLPGGKGMTEEQVSEAAEQRATRFGSAPAEAINEDALDEAWSIRTRGSRSFGFGSRGRALSGKELWIRDKDVVRRISPDGEVTGEVTIANPTYDQVGQDAFVAGQIGSRLAVVYLAPIPGEEEQFGWRSPKGATLTASDESGNELWQIELEVENRQLPRHLSIGNVDGRAGGEVLFIHQNALWIIDAGGEIIVRKPVPGRTQWLLVEDRDRDRRDEVYLRTGQKLIRYDYRGRR